MTLQRGGFAIGLIVGLLLGLTLALGVALYVTKVPVPFINKVPQRTADQDAAETERNKNWDPNAPLANKPALKAAPASAAATAVPSATRAQPATPATPAAVAVKPAASAAVAKSTKAGTDAFIYFIQVGAYARREDAEQQHARIGLLGMPAKVSEREQSGRTVYRVRLGPFDRKEEADAVQERLAGNGVEAALVRVER
jgi:cell division protein FtsN